MNRRLTILLLLIIFAAMVAAGPALAQCPMCKQALENSAEGQAAAAKLNLGILILLAPPVIIFAGLFGAIYRYRNVQGGARAPKDLRP
jgi:hypothetical protein